MLCGCMQIWIDYVFRVQSLLDDGEPITDSDRYPIQICYLINSELINSLSHIRHFDLPNLVQVIIITTAAFWYFKIVNVTLSILILHLWVPCSCEKGLLGFAHVICSRRSHNWFALILPQATLAIHKCTQAVLHEEDKTEVHKDRSDILQKLSLSSKMDKSCKKCSWFHINALKEIQINPKTQLTQ